MSCTAGSLKIIDTGGVFTPITSIVQTQYCLNLQKWMKWDTEMCIFAVAVWESWHPGNEVQFMQLCGYVCLSFPRNSS